MAEFFMIKRNMRKIRIFLDDKGNEASSSINCRRISDRARDSLLACHSYW